MKLVKKLPLSFVVKYNLKCLQAFNCNANAKDMHIYWIQCGFQLRWGSLTGTEIFSLPYTNLQETWFLLLVLENKSKK